MTRIPAALTAPDRSFKNHDAINDIDLDVFL
jgi:hypothetical protein